MEKGSKCSEEHKRKTSLALKGKPKPWLVGKPSGMKGKHQSEETKLKISLNLKGKKKQPFSDEHKKKLSVYFSNNPLSYWRGKHLSEEHRKKLAVSGKARKATDETRKKMSETMKMKFAMGEIKKVSRPQSPETREKIRRARLKQVFPLRDTKIERIMQSELEKQNVEFKTHIPLIGQPDVFIEPNICIFCDGDYWHNRPEAIKRDERITNELRSLGYVVFRFWEKDIKKDSVSCVEGILKFIEQSDT